jgi:hypothetical protein
LRSATGEDIGKFALKCMEEFRTAAELVPGRKQSGNVAPAKSGRFPDFTR